MPRDRGGGSHSEGQSGRSSSSNSAAKDDDLCPSSSSDNPNRMSSIVPSRSSAPCLPDSKDIIEDGNDAQMKEASSRNKKNSRSQQKQSRSNTDHPSDQHLQRPKLLQDPYTYLDDESSSSSSPQQLQTLPQLRRRRASQLQKHINHHSQAAKMGCFKAIILCYSPRKNKDVIPSDSDSDDEFDLPAPFLPSAVDSMSYSSVYDNNNSYLSDNNNSYLSDNNSSLDFSPDKKNPSTKRIDSGHLLRRTLSSTPTRRFKTFGNSMIDKGIDKGMTPHDFSGPMTFSTPSSASHSELLRSSTCGRRSPHTIMFSTSSGVLKPPQVELRLQCTLEELCFGCVKQVTVSRDIVDLSGQMSQKEEVMTVNVEPGWTKGTRIKFSDSGAAMATPTSNREDSTGVGGLEGYYSSDVIFVVAETDHDFLKRSKTNEEDLETQVQVSLIDALTGCDLSIPLLGDGNKMCLQIYDIVTPGYEKVIPGQGMPTRKDPGRRGDLRVKFKLEFPHKLEDSKRSHISNILLGE